MQTSQIATVVVWYHPTEEQRRQVAAYQHAVGQVYVVDNTQDNRGIAAALNEGIRKAIADGYEWVLTLDQDSHMDAELLRQLLTEAGNYPEREQVGVFSVLQDTDWRRKSRPRYTEEVAVMSSGNLVRTEAFVAVDGMREAFFIDLVDDDFCLRLHRKGWKVVRCNRVVMGHVLGSGYRVSPILRRRYVEHPAVRVYYIARNLLYVIHDYPEYGDIYRKRFRRFVKRLIIYDFIDKKQKIKALVKGIRDYRHRVTGPLAETDL